MTDYNIRRRLAEDGQTDREIEQLFDEIAEQRSDEQRDCEAEEHYKEKA